MQIFNIKQILAIFVHVGTSSRAQMMIAGLGHVDPNFYFVELYTTHHINMLSIYGIKVGYASSLLPTTFDIPANTSIILSNVDVAYVKSWFDLHLTYVYRMNVIGLQGGTAYVGLTKGGFSLFDVYGILGQNGFNTDWYYGRGWAIRLDDVTAPTSTFSIGDWSIHATDALTGDGCIERNANCTKSYKLRQEGTGKRKSYYIPDIFLNYISIASKIHMRIVI